MMRWTRLSVVLLGCVLAAPTVIAQSCRDAARLATAASVPVRFAVLPARSAGQWISSSRDAHDLSASAALHVRGATLELAMREHRVAAGIKELGVTLSWRPQPERFAVTPVIFETVARVPWPLTAPYLGIFGDEWGNTWTLEIGEMHCGDAT